MCRSPLNSYQVDPRDCATANILALREPKASNERINLAGEGLYTHQVLINIAYEAIPELHSVIAPSDKVFPNCAKHFTLSNEKSKRIFGDKFSYRPASESIRDYSLDAWSMMQDFKSRGLTMQGV